MSKIVVATTTFSTSMDLRADLAVQTVGAAVAAGHRVVVVDGSPEGVPLRAHLRVAGALVVPETQHGMAPSRRQALCLAGLRAGADGVVVWTEPEKESLVSHLEAIAAPIFAGKADITVPFRQDQTNYPMGQWLAEMFGNEVLSMCVGFTLDGWIGPRGMNQAGLAHFLAYGDEYGGKWDGIFIPILRAVAAGLRVVSVPINFVYPKEQGEAENNPARMLKCLEQLNNLVPAIVAEAKKLGLIAA